MEPHGALSTLRSHRPPRSAALRPGYALPGALVLPAALQVTLHFPGGSRSNTPANVTALSARTLLLHFLFFCPRAPRSGAASFSRSLRAHTRSLRTVHLDNVSAEPRSHPRPSLPRSGPRSAPGPRGKRPLPQAGSARPRLTSARGSAPCPAPCGAAAGTLFLPGSSSGAACSPAGAASSTSIASAAAPDSGAGPRRPRSGGESGGEPMAARAALRASHRRRVIAPRRGAAAARRPSQPLPATARARGAAPQIAHPARPP